MPPLREVRQTLDMIFRADDNQNTAQTDTELQAAGGAGTYLVVTDIILSANGAANTVRLVENTTSAVAVSPILYIAADDIKQIHLTTPIRLSENVNLGYTSTVANNHTVWVLGYTYKI